ncbi:MAG TPA: sugar ABC transporter permease [Mycobacterium sp.]|nr:sugar ABC transporter permease [Mycobacterium sp.]
MKAQVAWHEADGRPADSRRRYQWTGLILLAPAVVLAVVFFVFPVVYAAMIGFTNLSLVGPNAVHYSFTGLDNLKQLIGDSVFWGSAKVTALFVLGSGVLGVTVMGLLLALLIRSANRPVGVLVSSIVLVSWMLPPVTAAIMWYAFSTQGGSVSHLIGSPDANPLTSTPLLMVCLANVWSTTGFSMLVISAGLAGIPAEVEEAAEIEGANAWYRLRRVILPHLRPTLMTNIVLVMLLTIANFTIVWIMTQGGPGDATNILPVYAYRQAFTYQHLAYGSLLGLVLIVVASVIAIPFAKLSARGEA